MCPHPASTGCCLSATAAQLPALLRFLKRDTIRLNALYKTQQSSKMLLCYEGFARHWHNLFVFTGSKLAQRASFRQNKAKFTGSTEPMMWPGGSMMQPAGPRWPFIAPCYLQLQVQVQTKYSWEGLINE